MPSMLLISAIGARGIKENQTLPSHLGAIANRLNLYGRGILVGSGAVDRKQREISCKAALRINLQRLFLGFSAITATTAFISALQQLIPINQTSIFYFIPIVIAATRWGIWPAVMMAIASTCADDFFFVPPFYSFRIDDPQEALDLILFLFVALVSGNLAAQLWKETEALRRREVELQNLYELSQRLATCFTVSDLVRAVQHYLSRTLRYHAAFFPVAANGQLDLSGMSEVPPIIQRQFTAMTAAARWEGYAIHDEISDENWLIRMIGSGNSSYGVIAINIGSGSAGTVKSRTADIESVLEDATVALRRIDLGKVLEDAWIHAQTQLLKDALHGTVSHELRSPLAAIQGSASVLTTIPALRDDRRAHALIEGILDEVQELDGFIANLVNATRVNATGVEARKQWVDPQDIVNAALKQRARRLAAHVVRMEMARNLPLVNVDSVLVEEALGQLLENAAKYSPSGSTISVSARSNANEVVLSIADQGVGIAAEEQPQLGRKAFRSARHLGSVPGSGLGFWIATTFIRANGGSIAVSSPGLGGGTVASVLLPACWVEPTDLALLTDE